MAKDTSNTGKDSSGNEFDRVKNDVVKKGLEKNAARADEVIVAQSKDSNNAAIQAGNAARMEGLSSAGAVPKNPSVSDPLRSKPTVEPLDDVAEYKKSSKRKGTGRREKTGNLDFGTLVKKAPNPFDAPAAVDNRIDRMQSGMGLPGSQNGDLDLALKLHARDLHTARTTGKVVNDVHPNDSSLTSHNQIVTSPHHTAFARVMRVMGVADEEVYKNAASASGTRLPAYIQGLHSAVQQHEDHKSQIDMKAMPNEYWLHPKTGEHISVAANHPDMPSAFMRTKGLKTKVTRGPDGSEVRTSGHEGWDRATVRGGKKLLYSVTAPTKGTDLIDHLRVQMLSDHGPSATSRKKGADIAGSIADAASGAVPRGMMQIGKRKVAVAEQTGIVGETRPDNSRIYKKTFTTKEGTAPLLVPKPKRGRSAGEPPNPPNAKRNLMLVGKGEPSGSAQIPFYKDAPAKKNNLIDEASYKNPKRDPSRGQQFAAIDTEGMTGAQEVSALRSQGALSSQKNLSESKEVEVRPGGKKQASKDRSKPVQMSMFPDIKTPKAPKESRKVSFYMDGTVQPISESSKRLQADATKRFGRKEDAIAVEGKYSGANDAKLEQPEGSRAGKKSAKKLATES